ncbi:MAG: CcoQ/FixQ family Cbb3-type cytochrome c oxidase assembly chaperone [Bacteroidia bacterium]
MKFINYLKGISGVDVYPMIGLFIFTFFFLGVLVWILGMDKNKVKQLEEIPMQDGTGSVNY